MIYACICICLVSKPKVWTKLVQENWLQKSPKALVGWVTTFPYKNIEVNVMCVCENVCISGAVLCVIAFIKYSYFPFCRNSYFKIFFFRFSFSMFNAILMNSICFSVFKVLYGELILLKWNLIVHKICVCFVFFFLLPFMLQKKRARKIEWKLFLK